MGLRHLPPPPPKKPADPTYREGAGLPRWFGATFFAFVFVLPSIIALIIALIIEWT
jgi:hypothetical protein